MVTPTEPQATNPALYVGIEGSIGSGKTTLARQLAERIGAVALIAQSQLNPFIADFYADPASCALQTEIAFLLVHYHQLQQATREGQFLRTVISDFSLERDTVFARVTLSEEKERGLFEDLRSVLSSRVPKRDIVVYLRAPVDFLLGRIARRGRKYEKLATRQYLETVNAAMDQYFLHEYTGRKIVFDAQALDETANPEYLLTVEQALRKP